MPTDTPDPIAAPAPFERFVAPARARPALWRLVLGTVLIGAVWAGLAIALIAGIGLSIPPAEQPAFIENLRTGATPEAVLLLMLTFAGLALGPMLAARFLHARPLLSVIGPLGRLARDFAKTAAVIAVISGLSFSLWSLIHNAVPNLPASVWLGFLPLALAGVLLQTGAEEIAFRGYLLQQLAARFSSPVVWMWGSALIFGAVHYSPDVDGLNRWLVMLWAAGFGLVAADLTRVTGSIGAALGFHFANNVAGILFVATPGVVSGLSLYLTPYSISEAPMASSFAADALWLIVGWFLCRLALRR